MNEEGLSCEAPMHEMELTSTEFTGVKEYVPSAGDILISNAIRIEVVDCGATVKVGCKTIAFSTVEEALEQVNLYFKDPVASYKKWNNRFIQR
jgi:hypothetical protein